MFRWITTRRRGEHATASTRATRRVFRPLGDGLEPRALMATFTSTTNPFLTSAGRSAANSSNPFLTSAGRNSGTLGTTLVNNFYTAAAARSALNAVTSVNANPTAVTGLTGVNNTLTGTNSLLTNGLLNTGLLATSGLTSGYPASTFTTSAGTPYLTTFNPSSLLTNTGLSTSTATTGLGTSLLFTNPHVVTSVANPYINPTVTTALQSVSTTNPFITANAGATGLNTPYGLYTQTVAPGASYGYNSLFNTNIPSTISTSASTGSGLSTLASPYTSNALTGYIPSLLANTGLTNTGLLNTGLLNTGLTNTGLLNTGLSTSTSTATTGLGTSLLFTNPHVVTSVANPYINPTVTTALQSVSTTNPFITANAGATGLNTPYGLYTQTVAPGASYGYNSLFNTNIPSSVATSAGTSVGLPAGNLAVSNSLGSGFLTIGNSGYGTGFATPSVIY